MTPVQTERNTRLNPDLVNRMVGIPPDAEEQIPISAIFDIAAQLTPAILGRERSIAQAVESQFISIEADGIADLLQQKNLPMPSLYGVFTVGFDPPQNAIHLGKYEEYPFEGFPKTAIAGHSGDVFAAPIGESGEIMLILKGRAHPNEWVGERFSPMIVAHPLRVVKEMVRRQRVDEKKDPPIILTYVTGVTDGYKMKPGNLGIVVDDTELASVLHPGYGPRDILDPLEGEHFQPKAGRATTPKLGKLFVATAQTSGIDTYPVAVCGTPGMTEYQSLTEVPIFQNAFETARQTTGLKELARDIYGETGDENLAPLWDMGISFEEATLRQIKKIDISPEDDPIEEQPFSVLAVTLTTDLVGGKESLLVNHPLVTKRALATSPRNSALVMDFAQEVVRKPFYTNHKDSRDWTIRNVLSNYAL